MVTDDELFKDCQVVCVNDFKDSYKIGHVLLSIEKISSISKGDLKITLRLDMLLGVIFAPWIRFPIKSKEIYIPNAVLSNTIIVIIVLILIIGLRW